MSCLPDTPIADHILSDPATDAWQDVGVSLITTALSQYYPIFAGVVGLGSVMNTSLQHGILRQFEFEETAASSGDVKKCPLLILMYGATPSTPTAGAVYNNSNTVNCMGVIEITAADYKRVSDTVWQARVQPNIYLRTGNVSVTTVNFVILSNSATSITYASGAEGRVRGFFEQATAL